MALVAKAATGVKTAKIAKVRSKAHIDVDDVVKEAFALADKQKKRRHNRARCISDAQMEEEMARQDRWDNRRWLGADEHTENIDYGDAQAFQDDEE